MSGLEPILIGAAIGGGVSAATGGNPLLGAALGAAGGGLGGFAGGAGGAASGAAGGATGGAAGGTVGGATGATAAQAFPVAAQAAIPAAPLAGSSASMVTNPLLAEMAAMDAALAAGGEGFAKTAGLSLLDSASLDKMLPLAGQMMGGGQKQQPMAMSAPQMRRGQAPQVQQPIDELMRMQMMAQRQRRPISLL